MPFFSPKIEAMEDKTHTALGGLMLCSSAKDTMPRGPVRGDALLVDTKETTSHVVRCFVVGT